MDLRYLSTFQMVAHERSFTRAAEKLLYAPSTITLHIQRLESQVGCKLFLRQGKRVQLSTAGRALYEQADALLRQSRALERTLKEIATGETGSLRIGIIEPAASQRLVPLLAQFCQEFPKIHITLEVMGTRMICQRVRTGHLEIGVCSPPAADLGLTFEPLFFEPIGLLIPESHPLAALDQVTPDHLDGQRLLLSEPYCAYRETAERFFAERGVRVTAHMQISNFDVLKRAVQAEIGVAVLPASAVNPPPQGAVLRALAGEKLALPVGLVRSPEHYVSRPVLENLLAGLRQTLSPYPLP